MFGIGLPEMIVIGAVALLVVGPDKLPSLARSLAKGVFEMKSTVNQVKQQLVGDTGLDDTVSDLRGTTRDIKELIAGDTFRPPAGGVQGPDKPTKGKPDAGGPFSPVSEGSIDTDPEVIEAVRAEILEEEQSKVPPTEPSP